MSRSTRRIRFRREAYAAERRCLLREVREVGWLSYPRAKPNSLTPHSHPTLEICLVRSGSVEWWAGEDLYHVPAGHFFITRPGEPHGGVGSVTHPSELYWLQVDLDDLASATRDQSLEGRIAQKLCSVRPRQFPCDQDSAESFDRLLREYRQPGHEAEIVAKSALLSLLGSVLRTGSQPSPADHSQVSALVRKALRLMEERCAERVTVSEIALALGGDARWLHERFEAELRVRPVEQLARIRIQKACDRLRHSDEPITRIAHTLGFSSSQYFATVFRHHTGLTPRQYRALNAPVPADTGESIELDAAGEAIWMP